MSAFGYKCPTKDDKPVSLKYLNLAAAILHFLLAFVFIGYYANLNNRYANQPLQGIELSMRDHTLNLQIINNGCSPTAVNCDTSGNTIRGNYVSSETSVTNIRTLQWILISFFLITGGFHLFYFISEYKSGFNGLYQTSIANANNYFRWIEYSITSTLMLYAIAMVSGVKDTNIYILLAFNNVAMIYMGQLVEEKVKDKENPYAWLIPMFISWALLISEWLVIIRTFTKRLGEVKTFIDNNTSPLITNIRIPSWIQFTIYILAFFFICFGFISIIGAVLGLTCEGNSYYGMIERTYIIASFVAKATLGIFMAYGLGQRQQAGTNNIPIVV